MKSITAKRLAAFFIDMIIITLITSLISAVIPTSDKVKELTNERESIYQSYYDKKISDDEYLEQSNEVSYQISYETLYVNIIKNIIMIGYFIIYQYQNNGQTFGKKLMKIKVVKEDDSKLTANDFAIRSLIINSLLIGTVDMVMILILSKATYIGFNSIVYLVQGVVMVGIFLMVAIRSDKRGLHDLITKTKVIIDEEVNREGV